MVNCTANKIPLCDHSFDRIAVLESAHHFKRLSAFFREARRLVSDDGVVVLAIPAIESKRLASLKLGILNLTWTSLHYSQEFLEDKIKKAGFNIEKSEEVGNMVYEPLADYYLKNRDKLRKRFSGTYSNRIEGMINRSMKKMQKLSQEKIIQYYLMRLVPS